MGRCVLAIVIAMATVAYARNDSSSSMFGELPRGNYSADTIDSGATGSLRTLFDMARGFVDVVFRPFEDLSDFILEIIRATSTENGNAWQYLSENWQEAAQFEAGYIACLVFGALFIVFVPLVGSIVCCCRCCCNNCGGRLEQSNKRSKSCWRQCLCLSMLVLTTLMAIPTVFVFLTNEWITDVIDEAPNKIEAVLGDAKVYIELVPSQVEYVANEYTVVDDNVRPLVEDFGVSIGIPLQQYVNETAQPALTSMDQAIDVVDDTTAAIAAVNASLAVLQTGMVELDQNLTQLRNEMEAGLNDGPSGPCFSDRYCLAVYNSTSQLAVGFNVADLSGLSTDLETVNDQLTSFDVKTLRSDVDNEINDIPEKTSNETEDASQAAVDALDTAKSTVDDITSTIPTSQLDNILNNIDQISNSISDGINAYDENFDQYRYIAGLVLGSMLAFIVACYLLGQLLGICGNDRKVSSGERGCASNCGGIWLMVGVGFSFIFSWLLMILVIVLFTIGGHGERYGCQGLEGPNYPALAIVEEGANVNLAQEIGLPSDVNLTLAEVLNSCKDDASAYQALKLEYLFNITAYMSNVTDQLNQIEDDMDQAVNDIDLSSIDLYTTQNQQDLLSLKESGIEDVDFNQYLNDLGTTGVTAYDLTVYEAFLRASAANFTTAEADYRDLVLGYADEVNRIQREQVNGLQDDYDTLNNSINILIGQTTAINQTIDNLDSDLTALDTTIQAEGDAEIEEIADDLYNQVSGNITSYTNWVATQLTDTLGACRPVYNSYTASIAVFCDYLIDTINGLWFSLGWAVFFLIPSAIVAMKLMKFFRRMSYEESYEDSWDDMQMNDFGAASNKPNGGTGGYY